MESIQNKLRVVCGDFNEIMYSFEKKEGWPQDEKRIEAFREVLRDCQLYDLGYSGHWFTWERGNFQTKNIWERLDRGVTNESMIEIFPSMEIRHLLHTYSDHYPFLFFLDPREVFCSTRSFRFEAWWILEDTFDAEVRRIWELSNGDVLDKLKALQDGLKLWVRLIRQKKEWVKRRANGET